MCMDATFKTMPTETEGWLLTQYESNHLQDQMNDSADATGFISSQWPFMNAYYSPLRPVFTTLFKDFRRTGSGPEQDFMLRDGIVPLFWFFLNENTNNLKDRLVVHEDLDSWVPRNWRYKVSLYSVHTE